MSKKILKFTTSNALTGESRFCRWTPPFYVCGCGLRKRLSFVEDTDVITLEVSSAPFKGSKKISINEFKGIRRDVVPNTREYIYKTLGRGYSKKNWYVKQV